MASETHVIAPFAGTVIAVARGPEEAVGAGDAVVVLEAMKMEHEVVVGEGGTVRRVNVAVGQTVEEGQLLAVVEIGRRPDGKAPPQEGAADGPREDLQKVLDRHALTQDEARPEAVAKRHAHSRSTARENLADLVDEGTFVEYGPLIFAAQERRRSKDEPMVGS